VDLLILAGGLALLLLGGYALVQGASGLASSFGVSQIVIGLTVVAFGTSAPELAVNLTAALRGSSGLSFGNVIGSNLANLGLILGTAALVRPLVIESRVVAREIPMMLLATSAVAVLGLAADLSLRPGSYDRADGSVLLLLFGVFIYNAVRDVLQARRPDAVIEEARMTAERREPRRKRIQNGLLTLLGLAGLYLGGELTVAGATGIARSAGLSEAVIGLTVVAVGTSLPELVTSIIAAMRGQEDIAVGNVVGSNIFNLLMILGVSSAVSPVEVPSDGVWDLAALLLLSVLLLPLSMTNDRTLVRWEGALFLVAWVGYTAARVGLATAA
jgi:cation:H+ antiporter